MSDAADLAFLEEQLGRTPYPPARVVCRCPAGRPVAVEQPPTTPDGAPFPTTFWLTCPGLIHAVSVLEGAGGVHALEEQVAADADLATALDAAQARHAAMRDGLGIGGVRNLRAVKCLHAHVAFALGAPPYPIGEALLAEAGGIPATCCMERA